MIQPHERSDEAELAAEQILAWPEANVRENVSRMMRQRRLSRTVSALNKAVLDHRLSQPVARRALERLGLWP